MQNGGGSIFSGTGQPGTQVFILDNGSSIGSGTVASDGTFVIQVGAGTPVNVGDSLTAAGGSPTGPAAAAITAGTAPGGAPAAAMSTEDAGATVITATGLPGSVVVVTDPVTLHALGSATVGSNGQVAISLSVPLTPGQTVDLVSGGVLQGNVTASATAGQPPVVTQGSALEEGSVIQGTGVPGASIQAISSSGAVLGTGTVDSQGHFSLAISGATAGQTVTIVENGLRSTTTLTAFKMGAEKAFTSANVFRPDQGGKLDLSFKPDTDDHVTVHIFNVAGELVRPLLEMDVRAGVLYAAQWDGRNGDGSTVASGLYIISVHGKSIRTTKKVVVIK